MFNNTVELVDSFVIHWVADTYNVRGVVSGQHVARGLSPAAPRRLPSTMPGGLRTEQDAGYLDCVTTGQLDGLDLGLALHGDFVHFVCSVFGDQQPVRRAGGYKVNGSWSRVMGGAQVSQRKIHGGKRLDR